MVCHCTERKNRVVGITYPLWMECYASSLGRIWEKRLKPAGQVPLVLLKPRQERFVHDVSHRTLNFNCFAFLCPNYFTF